MREDRDRDRWLSVNVGVAFRSIFGGIFMMGGMSDFRGLF